VPVVPVDDAHVASSTVATPFGPGVHVANLDWCSVDRSRLLQRARPDVIIACDTIYLPELHQALGEVVVEGLQFAAATTAAAATSTSSSSSSSAHSPRESGAFAALPSPCAYFAQMNRNPDTFTHYLSTFAEVGLHVESRPMSHLPARFAYDREAIEFHRFTLQQSRSPIASPFTAVPPNSVDVKLASE
jgi:hypothetical protein